MVCLYERYLRGQIKMVHLILETNPDFHCCTVTKNGKIICERTAGMSEEEFKAECKKCREEIKRRLCRDLCEERHEESIREAQEVRL